MKITFLGTSGGKPSRDRNLSAIALSYDQKPDWYLIDCGEATQHQLMRSDLKLGKLSKIFITHLHGDHCYGLPGLLSTRVMEEIRTPLTVYGPNGIKEYLEAVKQYTKSSLLDNTQIIEIQNEGEIIEFDTFKLQALPLDHSVTSYAYCFFENDISGNIDTKALETIGLKPSKLYGEIKKGKNITLPNGQKIEAQKYLLDPIKGRNIIIAGDNCNPELITKHIKNIDLLIHEATYTQEIFDNLKKKVKHTTAKALGQAAQNGDVKNLIATHISPRYTKNPDKSKKDIAILDKELKDHFKGNCFIANDFDTFIFDKKTLKIKKYSKS
ncbi:MAG: ribonuclease Z [Campylobacterota bacterium]|nr:ribonuclease Z [Campylobacterota bacterium]